LACLGGGEVAAGLVDVLSPGEQQRDGDQKDEMEKAEEAAAAAALQIPSPIPPKLFGRGGGD